MGHKWRVSATVFVDFVPLTIEACTYAAAGGVTSLDLKHEQSDAVRFKRVCDKLVAFLRSSGMHASTAQDAAANVPLAAKAKLVDDDAAFMDDLSTEDPEASWNDRVELVMADLDSQRSYIRELAAQSMARWATSSTASHVSLAQGFADRAEKFAIDYFGNPQAPLVELYPLAATLRCVACGGISEAYAILSQSPIAATIQRFKAEASAWALPIVAKEMSCVMREPQFDCQKASCHKTPPATPFASVASTEYVDDSCPGATPLWRSEATEADDVCEASEIGEKSNSASATGTFQSEPLPPAMSKAVPPALLEMSRLTNNLFESVV
jgi:hypothetical protein